MKERLADVIVIGGGPSGMAAASSCRKEGTGVVFLVEREGMIGGILPQCIHPGFGLLELNEDLTGPEFAERLEGQVHDLGVEVLLDRFTRRLVHDGDRGISVECISPEGLEVLKAPCLIYSTGCRERHAFEIGIVGDRPSGVFTAGTAQSLMDLYGLLPGKEIVVVGSGDVGLIMSRRFAIEGAHVKAVVEILPYSGGLTRNVVQCLDDFGIPLLLSHAVLEIRGRRRVESVVITEIDGEQAPIRGTEREVECDAVVVAAGLVPEVGLLKASGAKIDPATGGPVVNEFLETSLPGVFACGNVLVVNDLVDHAVEQGRLCARSARSYLDGSLKEPTTWKRSVPGKGMRFVVPQLLSGERDTTFYTRVRTPRENCRLLLKELSKEIRIVGAKPSEMIRLSLKSDLLSKVKDDLTFEVQS